MDPNFQHKLIHNIRTPATVIKWSLELIAGEIGLNLTASQSELLGMIRDSNEKILAYLADLSKTTPAS